MTTERMTMKTILFEIFVLVVFIAYLAGWLAIALNIQHKVGRPFAMGFVSIGTFFIFYPQIRAAAIWIYQLF